MTLQAKSHDGWRSAVPRESSWWASNRDTLFAAFAAALVGLLYLDGGFVWDDGPLIVQRLARADASQILSLWTSPVTETGPGSAYYRPVALTILSVLGRSGPFAIHLLAAGLHVCSAALMVRCCAGMRTPLLGAFVFACHPLVSEVLGWSSALPDALAVTFGLLAVNAGGERPKLRFVFLLLGVLSKETALLIPIAFVFSERRWVEWVKPWVAAFAIAGALRLFAGVTSGLGWVGKLSLLPSAMGWAMGALVWPFPQHAVRDIHVAPIPVVAIGWVVIVGLFWLARRHPVAIGGAALVLLAHLVAMPVVLDGYLLGERYSYPALVGLGVWSAVIVPKIPLRLLIPGAGLVSYSHVLQADRWTKDLTLFDRVETHAHGSSYAWHLLGIAQLDQSLFSEAALSFEASLTGGNPYPGDRVLHLQALVLAGKSAGAFAVAEDGPTEGLTAQYVAWWARAAWESGKVRRARELLLLLRVGGGFDGPEWVPGLADRVFGADVEP